MTSNGLPDRDTLLMWISAYFDGELAESEEELLFTALDSDPDLEAEFVQMEKLLGGAEELPGLTDAILSAVAPEAVSQTPAGAALLASAQLDDELDATGTARLDALLQAPDAAAEVMHFAHAAEGVSAALQALPDVPAVMQAAAASAAKAVDVVAAEERAAVLFSAALDDELSADETRELDGLVAAHALPPLSIEPLQEALSVALRAPVDSPYAAKAGAAALQVIAADAARARDAARDTSRPTEAVPSFFQRARAALGSFAAPLSFATAAAAIFMMVRAPGAEQAGKGTSPDQPPAEWLEQFGADLLASADPGDLAVLGDNSETEVQAIDSGSRVAAVFSTEATSITVIWVPEPDDGAPTESGT